MIFYRNEEELSVAVSSFLKYRLRRTAEWKFKDSCPLARLRNGENIPVEVEGKDASVIQTDGMITDIKIRRTSKEESKKDTSFFVALPKDAAASLWISENLCLIREKAREASDLDYESFSLDSGLGKEVNTEICRLLVKENGFIGARTRRGKVIAAVKESALREKPRRSRKRTPYAETTEKRPEKLLRSLAVNFISDNSYVLTELSERARAKGNRTFSLVPRGLDRDAWFFLKEELKKQGFKGSRIRKNRIVVRISESAECRGFRDDDFLAL